MKISEKANNLIANFDAANERMTLNPTDSRLILYRIRRKALEDYIAELEAEKECLKSCENALISFTFTPKVNDKVNDSNDCYVQEDLEDYIAELERKNERLKACESALISMVNQFFYTNDDDNILRHAFMSAEEEAANYLVEHGIAQWVDERKGAIYFKEVQE